MKPIRILILPIVSLLFLISPNTSFQKVLAQVTPEQAVANFIKSNYSKREVMIPMRDGIKLFTAIY